MVRMKIDEWEQATSKSFSPLQIQAPSRQNFWAELHEVNLADVHLYDMSTAPHKVVRPQELIDPTATAFCKLSLQIRGNCVLEQDGRRCTLSAGDLGLYVTQRPYTLNYDSDQHSMVMIFPQDMIQMSPDQVALITATPVSRNQGLGRVAVPLFEQLAQNVEVLSGPHAISLVRSSLDILVTVLSAQMRESAKDDSHTLLFHQAVSYIDAHLSNPELSPTLVANALFISLRQLHTRFSEHGLTLSAFIKQRRLKAIRQDLANPILSHESIGTISARYGLVDAAYISKAFKAEFGEPPAVYRKRVLG